MRTFIIRFFILLYLLVPALALAVTPVNVNQGWNLLGNSSALALNVATTFGDPGKITTVWKWNRTTGTWAFYAPSMTSPALATYAQGKGYEVLTRIDAGDGFWVNAAVPFTLEPTTDPGFSLADKNLATGWNLVATADDIAPGAFSGKVGNITTLWAWDSINNAWYFYAPSLATNSTLASYIQTKGYKDFGTLTLGKGLGFWVNASPIPTLNTIVTIDDSVPASIVNAIAQVASPINEAIFGKPLPIPANSESAVVALDAGGKMMLAGLATSSATPLNAQTTALAFARFALGQLGTLTPLQANQAILSAAEFPGLVSNITQALAAGTSPVDFLAVTQSLAAVVMQAGQTLNAALTAAPGSTLARSLAHPTVSEPLPYVVFPSGGTGTRLTIYVAGSTANGGVNLVNNRYIFFSAQAIDLSGKIISPNPATSDGSVLLEGAEISLGALFNAPSLVEVPGNGKNFNIKLFQSSASKTANVFKVGMDIVLMTVSFAPGGGVLRECIKNVFPVVLPPSKVALFVAQSTPAPFLSYLKGLAANSFTLDGGITLAQAIGECFKPSGLSQSFFGATLQLAAGFAGYVGSLSPLTQAFSVANLAAEVSELSLYFSKPEAESPSVGVCINDKKLVNCAASLVIDPIKPSMAVGQTLALGVTARDISNGVTATPTDLVWSSQDELFATIVADSGVVTGKLAGSARIRVEDPASGASGSTTVTIGKPVISNVTPATVVLNRLATFTVTGTQMPDGMAFMIPSCGDVKELPGGNSTKRQFSCMPSNAGDTVVDIKDKPAGVSLVTNLILVTVAEYNLEICNYGVPGLTINVGLATGASFSLNMSPIIYTLHGVQVEHKFVGDYDAWTVNYECKRLNVPENESIAVHVDGSYSLEIIPYDGVIPVKTGYLSYGFGVANAPTASDTGKQRFQIIQGATQSFGQVPPVKVYK